MDSQFLKTSNFLNQKATFSIPAKTLIQSLVCSALLGGLLMPSTTFANAKTDQKTEIFTAAGFKNTNGSWRGKCSMGHIPVIKDINGDGRLDAIVRDGGTECYASTGVGFYLLTTQKNGKWTRIFNSPGEPQFLKSVGRHGWPEMVVTNPSKCHNVFSWDGSKFNKVRQEFKAKPCS